MFSFFKGSNFILTTFKCSSFSKVATSPYKPQIFKVNIPMFKATNQKPFFTILSLGS